MKQFTEDWNRGSEQNLDAVLFRVVFEQNAIGMALRAVGPRESLWLEVNDKFCEIFGFTREELLQMTSVDLSCPEEQSDAVEYNKRLLSGETKSYSREKRYMHKDGHIIWANIWLSVVNDSDGKPSLIVSVIEDITERKAAEQALLTAYENLENVIEERTRELTESRNRLRAIFDNAPVEMYLKDVEGRYVEINRRFEELFNIKNQDAVGKFPDEIHGRELGTLVRGHDRRVLETGKVSVEDQKAATEIGGRVLRTVKFPVFDDNQVITGLGAVVTDITELENARSEAIQANRAKSEFLAAMSHELRTPLTSSLGGLGLLSNLHSEGFSEQGRDLLEMAIRNNKALLRLINELLDYEKFLSGTLIIETNRQEICTLIVNIIKDLQGYAQTQSVNFVFNEPEGPVFADVHEHRFEQIINNLLSNAAKFSEPGNDVNIFVDNKDGRVFVSVEDKGPGIPEEFRKNIFEHFTQADTSSVRKHSGTGLGLAISKVLTEGMGGIIDFETELGVGSTFSIALPASK